jgi:hypothetical protein
MKTYVLLTLLCLSCLTPTLVAQTKVTAPTTIPEEARKHFVMGTTMFNEAKKSDAFSQAATEFAEAARLAPQWSEARYDLALAKEAMGDYSGAMADLKLYQQFKLTDTEARTVQDKIYAIEAKQKMAVDEANSPAAQLERFIQSLDGGIWMGEDEDVRAADPPYHLRRVREIRNGLFITKVLSWHGGQGEPDPSQVTEQEHVSLTGSRFTYRTKDIDPNCNPVTVEISVSGNAITESHSCYGREITTTYVRRK